MNKIPKYRFLVKCDISFFFAMYFITYLIQNPLSVDPFKEYDWILVST